MKKLKSKKIFRVIMKKWMLRPCDIVVEKDPAFLNELGCGVVVQELDVLGR